MKQILSATALIAIFFLATHSTASYVRSPLSTGTPMAWNLTNPGTQEVSNGRITYNLNPAGSDDLPFSEVERALAASFQAWENIPTSEVAFQRGPNTSATVTTNDNVLQIYWLENTTNSGDGLNLAGTLGLTRLTTFTSGARSGEIIDGAIVFNGNQFKWATDGRTDAADLQEVATHEIGHLIGLTHSPIGGTTMFPRTGVGRTQGRTLAFDDQIAASVIYPSPGFLQTTATLRGNVRDGNGGNIFGAHVVAVDANGVSVAGGITLQDGSYTIQGLLPGSYNVYAEPTDPLTGAYFSRSDLQSFFSGITTDFQTSRDFPVTLSAGGTTTQNITVSAGAPALDGYFVYDRASGNFFNVGSQVRQGESRALVAVGGPGLPQSGTPLSISGPGITVGPTYFNRLGNGMPSVAIEITVSPDAPVGPRNMIITNGSQRTIVTGGVEILAAAAAAPAVVSSANFSNQLAAEALVSVFGQNLAPTTQVAATSPLPTILNGTSIRLRDGAGNERLAPLFFVSPTQINFQIAPGIQTGQTSVTITNSNGDQFSSSVQLNATAPGLFAANGTGKDLAAAVVFRRKANGQESFESLVRFDTASSQFVAIPIDLGPATDQVVLVLFGTGIRFRSSLSAMSYNVGGTTGTPLFAGAQGDFVGLDQINVPLSRNLLGRGLVNVSLTADGKPSNTVTINVK